VQVEGLRDDALAGERRVAVQQDSERDRRVVRAVPRRAVGLLRACAPFDDGVDGFEVARVRDEAHADLAVGGSARPMRCEVILDVAGAALGVGRDGFDRSLAFELAQDVLVGHPDRVREHVEAPAVRHPHHDLVRARLGCELDRLVEHGDHHVEPFERELLLAEEPLAQEALHSLHLAEAAEQLLLLVCAERLPVAAGLDRLPQPHALLVVGEVLELVGDRARVGLAEPRQNLEQRLARHVHAKVGGRDPRLELGRQLRLEAHRLERRVTDRLGAEWVEPRREMAMRAVRLDERHRRRDTAEELRVRSLSWFCRRGFNRGRRRRLMAVRPVAGLRQLLEQPGDPGMGRDELGIPALEERAPLRRDRFGILEVVVEQGARVAGVQPVDVVRAHPCVVPGECR
jgi:hypothetical protein